MSEGKKISLDEAMSHVKDGQRIMIGGFAGSGNPMNFVKAIVERGLKDLTLIANDTGNNETDLGLLTINKVVSNAIVSHIGTNRETVRQFQEGEINVEFSPQGTLVERIRAAGFGLGAILTPTGVGTEIAEGKEIKEINGKEYLVELPLHADVAIARVKKADTMGNVVLYGSNVSHSLMMLTAADLTIVQADKVVEVGEIKPNEVSIPGIFVDYVVEGSHQ